jgi:hypothetical protein
MLAFRWSWRAALLFMLWFLPGTLLYMAYYYGRGMPLIGYLRFFTSMLPPVVIGCVWLIHRAGVSMDPQRMLASAGESIPWWRRGSFAVPVAAGLFVAFPAAVNLNNNIASLERDHTIATNLADIGTRSRESIPPGSTVFGHSQRLLNYLQFAGCDYKLYGAEYFRNGFPVPSMGNQNPDAPNPIQPARRQFLRKAYDNVDNASMVRTQNKIITDAFDRGERVFVVLDAAGQAAFRRAFLPSSRFQTKTVQSWTDPARMSSAAIRTLSTLGADMAGRGSPQRWSIIEVLPKPPSTAPAVESETPATQPATKTPEAIQEFFKRLHR